MRIDFQADSEHAVGFEVIDLDTGKPPTDAEGHEYGIWRADDVTGTFEYYVVEGRNASGRATGFKMDPENPYRVMSEMKLGRIKIRPRPPADGPMPVGTKLMLYDILATVVRETRGDGEEPTRGVVYQVDPDRLDDFCDALKGIVKDRPNATPHRHPRCEQLRCGYVSKVTASDGAFALAIYSVPTWDIKGVDFGNTPFPHTD
jgi:hypothetical protein